MEGPSQDPDATDEALARVADPRSRAWLAAWSAFESAAMRGELGAALGDARVCSAAGALLTSAYACLHSRAWWSPTDRRRVSVERMWLEACEELAVPRLVFRVVATSPSCERAAASLRLSREIALDVEAGGAPRRLRFDQWTGARFWGAGFAFADAELGALAEATQLQLVARAAVRSLHDLEEIEHHFTRRPGRESPVIPPLRARQLERLMIDVLNEHSRCAQHARLVEDFFTATDLRVHVEGVERARGARVQVSSLCSRDHHDLKLERMLHSTEVSMLSPYSLADAIALGALGRLGLDERAFLDEFQIAHRRDHKLAFALWQVFNRALEEPRSDPLGPLVVLPPILREFMRRFVAEEARWTTENLRRREARGAPFRFAHRQLKHAPTLDAWWHEFVREMPEVRVEPAAGGDARSVTASPT